MAALEDFYFCPEKDTAFGKSIPPITSEFPSTHRPLVDRFFTRYYLVRQKTSEEHYLVLFHSNRICMVGLSGAHPAFAKGIEQVTCPILKKTDKQSTGEDRKRSAILQKDTTIAVVKCCDGTTYNVPSCVKGKLVEINQNVLQNPSLLSKEGYGYIAILLPKIDECDDIKASLLSHEEYSGKYSK